MIEQAPMPPPSNLNLNPDQKTAPWPGNKVVGIMVSQRREQAGLSQGQLALESGLPKSTIAALELGDLDWTLKQLSAVAKPLGIAPAMFLGNTAIWQEGQV
jgi:DNA-binding XRE family transcriptional regulator